jgi:hypothetical protein
VIHESKDGAKTKVFDALEWLDAMDLTCRTSKNRCCLKASPSAIWEKALLHSFLQTPFGSRVLRVSLTPTRMAHSQTP